LFDSAKAIVFGNLHGVSVDDDAKHSAAEARYPMIVSRFAEKVSVPVFVVKGPFDFGHSDWNLPFSLGTLADLIPGASVDTTKLRIAAS
jgi:muramoyltetrapeptide carboxypeptidase LdcA involved in peptidoglycan recycling